MHLVKLFLMKPSHNRRTLIIVLLLTVCLVQSATAQEPTNITVPLQITRPFDQPFMVAWIEFDQKEANYTTKRKLGEVRLGQLPGGLRVAVATVADSPKTYHVRVDTDGDRDLTDESAILIRENESVKLDVTRKSAGGETATLPYVLSYARNSAAKGMR